MQVNLNQISKMIADTVAAVPADLGAIAAQVLLR